MDRSGKEKSIFATLAPEQTLYERGRVAISCDVTVACRSIQEGARGHGAHETQTCALVRGLCAVRLHILYSPGPLLGMHVFPLE